jgi:hypothetical protein
MTLRATVLALLLAAIGCTKDSLSPAPQPPPAAPTVGAIEGWLCDGGGILTGARVGVDCGDRFVESTTDSAGYFRLEEIPAGAHWLEIDGDPEVPTWITAGATEVVRWGDCEPDPEPPAPDPVGSVEGWLCADGGVLAGTRVGVQLGEEWRETLTDAAGWFRLDDLPAGGHTLRVESGVELAVWIVEDSVTEVRDGDCEPDPVIENGGLRARICAPSGTYWLSGANVWIELADATVLSTTTDADGWFEIASVPPGTHTVHVTRGSFEMSFEATVASGETLAMPEPVCLPPRARIAVVSGLFDRVEHVLGQLGYGERHHYGPSGRTTVDEGGTIDVIFGQPYWDGASDVDPRNWPSDPASTYWLRSFLADPVWMSDYDIIMLNCGINDADIYTMADPTIVNRAVENLRAWVRNGGSLYVSDWASEILRLAFPGKINFLDDDSRFGWSRVGVAAPTQAAVARDQGLATALGHTDLTITLDLDFWVMLESMSAQPAELHAMVVGNAQRWYPNHSSAPVPDVPIVVQLREGTGRVLFTSAHLEIQTSGDLRQLLNYSIFEL